MNGLQKELDIAVSMCDSKCTAWPKI